MARQRQRTIEERAAAYEAAPKALPTATPRTTHGWELITRDAYTRRRAQGMDHPEAMKAAYVEATGLDHAQIVGVLTQAEIDWAANVERVQKLLQPFR